MEENRIYESIQQIGLSMKTGNSRPETKTNHFGPLEGVGVFFWVVYFHLLQNENRIQFSDMDWTYHFYQIQGL